MAVLSSNSKLHLYGQEARGGGSQSTAN